MFNVLYGVKRIHWADFYSEMTIKTADETKFLLKQKAAAQCKPQMYTINIWGSLKFSPVETINRSESFHLQPGQTCQCLKFKRSSSAPVFVSSETSAETPQPRCQLKPHQSAGFMISCGICGETGINYNVFLWPLFLKHQTRTNEAVIIIISQWEHYWDVILGTGRM